MDQSLSADLYEVIVVNNASTDNTKNVIEELNHNRSKKLVYIDETRLGLHHARHAGASIAQGDILVFCDDDIVASQGWLDAIFQSFSDEKVGLVTGKISPCYEVEPPCWIEFLWTETRHGRSLGFLSLLDMGDKTKEIPPTYCYGCNFSIRKKILYECRGFNPDGMPQELICFRGDGETALAMAASRHYKIVYNPQASIKHYIPKSRMTIDYICKRAFNQGVSDSYSHIRKQGKVSRFAEMENLLRLSKRVARKLLAGFKNDNFMNYIRVHYQLEKFYQQGWRFHQNQARRNRDLLEYILKPSYFPMD